MQLPELDNVVRDFFKELVSDCPDLKEDAVGIAQYLVTGQDDGDNRRIAILKFLKSADSHLSELSRIDATHDLLGYLLQTLVIRCEIQNNGLTKIPVNRPQTVELINAARIANPLVPGYAEDNLEFKNGQRNSRLENIGDFLPPTGDMEVEVVCQEIAKILLKTLGDPDKNPDDPLRTLKGNLRAYDLNPGESPLQGIQIKADKLADHPFNVPVVVKRFTEMTENLLPIYVYGFKETSEANDCLHSDEEDIRGLVIQNYKIVENYNTIHQKKPKTSEELSMHPKIKLSNIGDNTPINIVVGEQTNTQVGQGNIQFNNQDITQLQQLLEQLIHDAELDDSLGKIQFADINLAAEDIKTEIQKNQNPDKNVLKKAKQVLEGFENVTSIAGSIEKITQLLLPFIG